MKLNFSGKVYNATSYGVEPDTFLIDMDKVRDKALEHKPTVLIATPISQPSAPLPMRWERASGSIWPTLRD